MSITWLIHGYLEPIRRRKCELAVLMSRVTCSLGNSLSGLCTVTLLTHSTVPISGLLLAANIYANLYWLEPLRIVPAIVACAIFLPLCDYLSPS